MTDERQESRGGPAEQTGMSVPEYERRVWDLAKHLVHPAFFYALIQVIGITRLSPHPFFRGPSGGWWELAFFAASFLGAWAVFYSTMMRDAGLRSRTVTVLVPLALVGLLAGWFALPAVDTMTPGDLLVAALLLAGLGPLAWIGTMVRWSRARKEMADVLDAGAGR